MRANAQRLSRRQPLLVGSESFLRAEVGALEADLVVDRDLRGRKKLELLARDNS